MSTTDAAAERARSRELEKPESLATQEWPRETPIVPRATIAGRALVAVVAIMTFLASLTSGAVMLVRAAADEWQAEVAREVTIQIRATPGRDLESEVFKAVTIARGVAGIAEVRPYSKEESARLLEPWLGSGLRLDDLPVPRIVVVRIAPGAAPDLAQLRDLLSEQVPGASLDDHRGFVDRMRTMSRAALAGGIGVLLLVLTATVLSVTFATRAAMATNRPVIEVLHLIGAKDNFIAGHFQRHFLQLGLVGGLIGGGSAVALFAFAELASGWVADDNGGGDQFAALFGSYSIGVPGYLTVLAQIALIAFVTAATSRHTVNRTIATIH
jgi:cell division transport system permease protein